MKIALLIAVLGILLAVSIWFAATVFSGTEAEITGHGWFAMALGAIFSILVGGGLMALVFFSSRRGYDDIDRDV